MLALVASLVESALDIRAFAASDGHGGTAHEIHGDLHPDDSSPAGGNDDVEHFCHCVTHGAALAFSMELAVPIHEFTTQGFRPADYRSVAIPPPVPPPDA
jgi:hypothetical protein